MEKMVRNVLLRTASRLDTTPTELRQRIRQNIETGWTSADPDVRRAWREIPCAGELPTPEEAIVYWADVRVNKM